MAEGIEVRHAKGCRSRSGARCNCEPSYRAHIWSQRNRRRIRKTFASRADAKAWRAEAQVAIRRGTLQPSTSRTLQQAAEAFLSGMSAGTVRTRSGAKFKPSTIRTYKEKLHGCVLPALGDYRLAELPRRDVQDLADALFDDGYSPSSVRNTIDPLRSIYRYAIRRDEVVANPTTDLELPSSAPKPKRIAPPAEAWGLLDALPNGDRAVWATAFFAGLRRGELQALPCTAIDLGENTIRVERSWDQYEGRIDPKSASSTRTLVLLGELRPYLTQHLLATGRRDADLVFGRTASDAFVPSTVRSRADKAWEAAALDRITLHECRHTYASMLIASGANEKTVMEALGHSTITMTFDTYGHLFPGNRDELRERMNAYLAGERDRARGTMAGQ